MPTGCVRELPKAETIKDRRNAVTRLTATGFAERLRRYWRCLLFCLFEHGTVHLIDVLDGRADESVHGSR